MLVGSRSYGADTLDQSFLIEVGKELTRRIEDMMPHLLLCHDRVGKKQLLFAEKGSDSLVKK